MPADGDLLIVRELRKMSTLSKQGAKIAAPVSDEQLKWLNWPNFVQVCQAIRDAQSLLFMDISLTYQTSAAPD